MRSLYNKPLDQTITGLWLRVDDAYKKAFFFIVVVNLLAFGFEMTNLTIHHDDIWQIFLEDNILGYYLGRFGLGWLHYKVQNAHIMPFLQMAQGIILMTAYGMVISYLWGIRKTVDIVIVSSTVCVFPYMAQIYTYNAAMATYPIAHLLSAVAVLLSTRAKLIHIAIASVLYVAAFSIYQSVIANAATIFCMWALSNLLFNNDYKDSFLRSMIKPTVSACLSVIAGSLLYFVVVSFMDINFDSYQDAEQAFSFKGSFNPLYAATEVINGSRSFFLWPEHYFPNSLKKLQLIFLAAATIFCLWLPKGFPAKIIATVILVLSILTPRILQMVHPAGVYHNLTLTAYAVSVAGFVMVINRARFTLTRNLSIIIAVFLIGGYIVQCNWISTVNYLNTQAHYATLTQILARVRSLPVEWNGEKIIVVGSYKMKQDYPYKMATGVATDYIDMKPQHMQQLARLMRDDITFTPASPGTPGALEYAMTHSPWPHPSSVGIVNGTGVVVLSNDHLDYNLQKSETNAPGSQNQAYPAKESRQQTVK
jgi:hypothetical protein